MWETFHFSLLNVKGYIKLTEHLTNYVTVIAAKENAYFSKFCTVFWLFIIEC